MAAVVLVSVYWALMVDYSRTDSGLNLSGLDLTQQRHEVFQQLRFPQPKFVLKPGFSKTVTPDLYMSGRWLTQLSGLQS